MGFSFRTRGTFDFFIRAPHVINQMSANSQFDKSRKVSCRQTSSFSPSATAIHTHTHAAQLNSHLYAPWYENVNKNKTMKSEDEVTMQRAWGDLKCAKKLSIKMNNLISVTVDKIKEKSNESEVTK
jgi:hypothetical protein